MKPTILEQIITKINSSVSAGLRPIVILDVDDTLVDCRHRKLAVIRDFSKTPPLNPLKEQLAHISLSQISYRVVHCLQNLGINDPRLADELFQFWLSRYFTTPYLINDIAFPGAAEFVTKLVHHGAHIVYLTARDQPGMGEGTDKFLHQSSFPYPHPQAVLMMKPDISQPDAAFKQSILPEIARKGEVIASFENEIAHLNHMADFFPQALMIWRDTQYAPQPPQPHARIQVLSHFHF